MAGNKKPRKKYKRVVIYVRDTPLPITCGMSQEMKTELRLPYHLALDALRIGQGSDDDAHLIFSTLLVAKALGKLFSADHAATISIGIDAIQGVKDLGDVTGEWGLSGDQFTAISAALVLMDDMQDAATRRDVRDALKTVINEARAL